jgi:hypothetical protein
MQLARAFELCGSDYLQVMRGTGNSRAGTMDLARVGGKSGAQHDRNPAELAAAEVLPEPRTIVMIEACALSSRQRAASTACAV